MIEIDWKKDYAREFVCPHCGDEMFLAGHKHKKRQFECVSCHRQTLASLSLKSRLKYQESRLKDDGVDWGKDYQGEFICPHCNHEGMRPHRKHQLTQKREFYCRHCQKLVAASCQINIQAIADPINSSITWYTQHKLEGLICPSCDDKNIYLYGLLENNKRNFICKTCGKRQSDSIDLNLKVISHKTETLPLLAPFDWENDYWDLRALKPSKHQRESVFTVNFAPIKIDWLKQTVKKYIYHLCQTNWSFVTISQRVWALQKFSDYLTSQPIRGFLEIDRKIILDLIVQADSSTAKLRTFLGALRHFLKIGTIHGWFDLDPDLIRNEDFPKRRIDNPNPISDIVREQIEKNLHQLPDPIARMWIVAFFTAMRPNELALLKRDCLVQEGESWKVVWQRPKTNDEHEVPITRTIAKVIQQQQEYIQNLWGEVKPSLNCASFKKMS